MRWEHLLPWLEKHSLGIFAFWLFIVVVLTVNGI